jgi:dihydropteroate synthase
VSRPYRLMGIVNVTPDSFSDGGLYLDAQAAIAHAERLARDGADILGGGGGSPRPGAEPVGEAEELARVIPVIEGIAASLGPLPSPPAISIDTSKAAVAEAALSAGARIVNDVSALRGDPRMLGVVAEAGACCVLMHMRGEPRTMQLDPRYEEVVGEVREFLRERMEHAISGGVARERIVLDPGIGFGKTEAHNLELLRRLAELSDLGAPLLVGTSRKAFLGSIPARAAGSDRAFPPEQRLAGTIASNVLAYERGARIFRVHDVAAVRDALAVAAASLGEEWTPRSAGTTQTSSTTGATARRQPSR